MTKLFIEAPVKIFSAEYEISKRMTIFDFIANLGGLFGLCLGFSIVSFCEIVFWFTIGLCRNVKWSTRSRKE